MACRPSALHTAVAQIAGDGWHSSYVATRPPRGRVPAGQVLSSFSTPATLLAVTGCAKLLRRHRHRGTLHAATPVLEQLRQAGGKLGIPLRRYRNIGIIAHIDAGKTTVSERILYYTGREERLGETHEGAAVMDFSQQERERGITISSAATTCVWRKHRINLIDTPGHIDFTVEVERSLRVLDGVVVVLDGTVGVQTQTETVWRQANRYSLPRIVFVNKMDKPSAVFFEAIESVEARLGCSVLPVQVPIKRLGEFIGVFDLVRMVALTWESCDPQCAVEVTREVPDGMRHLVKAYRERLLEVALEYDDALFEDYLDNGVEPEAKAINACIRHGTAQGEVIPALCGSALGNRGMQSLLDGIVDLLPSPLQAKATSAVTPNRGECIQLEARADVTFVGFVFKVLEDERFGRLAFMRIYSGRLSVGMVLWNPRTSCREQPTRLLLMHADDADEVTDVSVGEIVAVQGFRATVTGDTLCDEDNPVVLERITVPEPVLQVSCEAATAADTEGLQQALRRMVTEDPSLRLQVDADTNQTLLQGMGELHLEVVAVKLQQEFNVAASFTAPQVAYRETIAEKHEACIACGDTQLMFTFHPRQDVDFELLMSDGLVTNASPDMLKVVESAFEAARLQGLISGYPLVGFTLDLAPTDEAGLQIGLTHENIKAAMAKGFRLAGIHCMPCVLVPVMKVDVCTPEEYVGRVVGALQSRQAVVQDIRSGSQEGDLYRVVARAPLPGMLGFITQLRGQTQGKATFTMEPDGYEAQMEPS